MPTGSRALTVSLLLILTVAAAVAAVPPQISAEAPPIPAKAPALLKSAPPAEVARQGGDTIWEATWVTIPVVNRTGTTAGYNDDYDEVCPYSGSTSPDVVYTFVPNSTTSVDIDMYGSTYDTKIYVYCWNMDLVACNDDFYPDYVSKLENVMLQGQTQYYLVIDGWNGDFGDYVLTITEFEPCVIEAPAGAEEEMEPPLHDDYEDMHNGGCNSPEWGNPFGFITSHVFHGRSGWYLYQGADRRDTDWYEIYVPDSGFVEVIGDAEHPTYLFELGPQDCDSVGVIQNVIVGPCTEGIIVIPAPVGSTIWFWVGPTTFTPPNGHVGYEYDYVLYSNIGGAIAVESSTWSAVRDLYR